MSRTLTIEPMPVDTYAVLLVLLTDMIKDVEAVVADAEASCNAETARDGAVSLAAARALLFFIRLLGTPNLTPV